MQITFYFCSKLTIKTKCRKNIILMINLPLNVLTHIELKKNIPKWRLKFHQRLAHGNMSSGPTSSLDDKTIIKVSPRKSWPRDLLCSVQKSRLPKRRSFFTSLFTLSYPLGNDET